MAKDLPESIGEQANSSFATHIQNMRLVADGDTPSLVLANEKGTKKITLTQEILGDILGSCTLETCFIVFTISENEEIKDRIYKISLDPYNEDSLKVDCLYAGDLNFSKENPIQAIPLVETSELQKVYWCDGRNLLRQINVNTTPQDANEFTSIDSFSNRGELDLNETMEIENIPNSGGSWSAGVVQYAYRYYNKYSSVTNIAEVSSIYYTGKADRGGSPEETVNNSFKITIRNTDKKYTNIQLFSFFRSSLNGDVVCKKIQDTTRQDTFTFTDKNITGEIVDFTDFLREINTGAVCPKSIAQKSNTLFIGGYTTKQVDVDKADIIKHLRYNSDQNIVESVETPLFYDEDYYSYRALRKSNYYYLGVQFQNNLGEWEEPFPLGSYKMKETGHLKVSLDPDDYFKEIIKKQKYKKYRPVICLPTPSQRVVSTSGILQNNIAYTDVTTQTRVLPDYFWRGLYNEQTEENFPKIEPRRGSDIHSIIPRLNEEIKSLTSISKEAGWTLSANPSKDTLEEFNGKCRDSNWTKEIDNFLKAELSTGEGLALSNEYFSLYSADFFDKSFTFPTSNKALQITAALKIENFYSRKQIDEKNGKQGNNFNANYYTWKEKKYFSTVPCWEDEVYSSANIVDHGWDHLNTDLVLRYSGDIRRNVAPNDTTNENKDIVAHVFGYMPSYATDEIKRRYLVPPFTSISHRVGDISINDDTNKTKAMVSTFIKNNTGHYFECSNADKDKVNLELPLITIENDLVCYQANVNAGRNDYNIIYNNQVEENITIASYKGQNSISRYESEDGYFETINGKAYIYYEDIQEINNLDKIKIEIKDNYISELKTFFPEKEIKKLYIVPYSNISFKNSEVSNVSQDSNLKYTGEYSVTITADYTNFIDFADIEGEDIKYNPEGITFKEFFDITNDSNKDFVVFPYFENQEITIKTETLEYQGESTDIEEIKEALLEQGDKNFEEKFNTFKNNSIAANIKFNQVSTSESGYYPILVCNDVWIRTYAHRQVDTFINSYSFAGYQVGRTSKGANKVLPLFNFFGKKVSNEPKQPNIYTESKNKDALRYFKNHASELQNSKISRDPTDRDNFDKNDPYWEAETAVRFGGNDLTTYQSPISQVPTVGKYMSISHRESKDTANNSPALFEPKDLFTNDPTLIRYVSSPHVLIKCQNIELTGLLDGISNNHLEDNEYYFIEAQLVDISNSDPFSINTNSLEQLTFIPANKATKIEDVDNLKLELVYKGGDTFISKVEILKTYFKDEDNFVDRLNEVILYSGESYIHSYCRYDDRAYNKEFLCTNILDQNWGQLNTVYNQEDNLFSYNISSKETINDFPYTVMHSKRKIYGEEIDAYTNLLLETSMDVDTLGGPISALLTGPQGHLYCIQNHSVSQVLYADPSQITTPEGNVGIAPINRFDGFTEIAKFIGTDTFKRCIHTKDSIYLLDPYRKGLFEISYGRQAMSVSDTQKFKSWFSPRIIPVYKDKYKQETLWFDSNSDNLMIANSEYHLQLSTGESTKNTFTSFYSYEKSKDFICLQGDTYSITETGKSLEIWKLRKGAYNSYYDEYKPYYVEILLGKEGLTDKIYTNLELIAYSWGIEEGMKVSDYTNYTNLPIDTLNIWNDYQYGELDLYTYKWQISDIKRKFRIWRCNLPRVKGKPLERIRSPFAYLKIGKFKFEDSHKEDKVILHSLLATYFLPDVSSQQQNNQ